MKPTQLLITLNQADIEDLYKADLLVTDNKGIFKHILTLITEFTIVDDYLDFFHWLIRTKHKFATIAHYALLDYVAEYELEEFIKLSKPKQVEWIKYNSGVADYSFEELIKVYDFLVADSKALVNKLGFQTSQETILDAYFDYNMDLIKDD